MHGVLNAIRPNFNLDDFVAQEYSSRLLASVRGYLHAKYSPMRRRLRLSHGCSVSVEFVKFSIVMVEGRCVS